MQHGYGTSHHAPYKQEATPDCLEWTEIASTHASSSVPGCGRHSRNRDGLTDNLLRSQTVLGLSWQQGAASLSLDSLQDWDSDRFKAEKVLQEGDGGHAAQIALYFDSVQRKRIVVKRYPAALLGKNQEDFRRRHPDRALEDPWQEIYFQTKLGEEGPQKLDAVLKCYGAYRNEQCDGYLTTEWCPCGDVFAYATGLGEPGPEREAQAAPVLRSLLQAVENLHRRSIAHCDISAENALLRFVDGSLQVVLVDFAMAVGGNLSSVSGARGKLMYRAPETVKPGAVYDATAADLFACGVVAYALVTGNYPWERTDGNCKAFNYAAKHGIARFLHKRHLNIGDKKVSVTDVLSSGYQAVLVALLDMEPEQRCDLSSVYLSAF
eukprot:TRINITY_DN59970_c0_g1_i1.p1 TRINITY_DN59970_c0_g1~~TRINITY_DN59970_c0_g1_i1.p1  ORF type:complete len:410 (+),score=67.70 TRINITY_DN59970_c0_g1_i1:94-1230(+)